MLSLQYLHISSISVDQIILLLAMSLSIYLDFLGPHHLICFQHCSAGTFARHCLFHPYRRVLYKTFQSLLLYHFYRL